MCIGAQARILLVDDYRPFLDFISSLLREQPNVEIVGEVQDGFEAIWQAQRLQPDLIFLDIGLPGVNGIQAAGQIRNAVPAAKIVFLTNECSPEVVQEALKLGACGYIQKVHAARDVTNAINAVLSGERFLSNALTEIPLPKRSLVA